MVDTNRRRFLRTASLGAGLGLAGCTDSNDDTAPPSGNGTPNESMSGDGATDANESTSTDESGSMQDDQDVPDVAVVVEIDRMALRQRQQELQGQLQAGEINQTTYQEEIRSFQQELVTEAFDSFDEEVADDIDVEDRDQLQGAIRISGASDAVLRTLSYESVSALIDAEQLQSGAP